MSFSREPQDGPPANLLSLSVVATSVSGSVLAITQAYFLLISLFVERSLPEGLQAASLGTLKKRLGFFLGKFQKVRDR